MHIERNNILQFSYPISNSRREIWLSSFGVALAGYLFLIIFQPFGTYNYSNTYKYIRLIPYSIISFIIFSLGNFILPRIFKKWDFISEILKIILFLSICSVLNYWYSIHFINDTDFDFRALIYMGIFTFALGTPISIIYLLSRYIYLKEKPIAAIEEDIFIGIQGSDCLTVTPTVGPIIKLQQNNFVYARSEGNYSTLYYLEENKLKKQLIRISLKSLEEQICNASILRCHRSYIVNTNYIINTKGNSQGYKLYFQYVAESIPVSRKYIDIILKNGK